MCDDRTYGPRVYAGCFPFGPHDVAKIKHMARHFMRGFMGGFGSYIPYNVEDLGDRYLILVPLPGRSKEDVKVSLLNKHLNISAKKPKTAEKDEEGENEEDKTKADYCCSPFEGKGFKFIDVNMDIPLPADADENTINSKMANGLLKVEMAKKPAKDININEN
jgi:HSP20 family molecular chaperone IbpA